MTAHSPRISVASPTGQQWRIGHGRQELIVCEVGATLRAYSVGHRAVVDGFGADEWSHSGRGQVLAPWPNRLADGRYEFNGVRAQAALDEPERRNAIHGLVRWMPWTLQTRHQNQLSLRLQLHPSPGYPFSLLLELEYHVGREGLTVTTRAQSLEEVSIPFGIGFHPYLTAGPETVDGAILQVPARHTLDVDDRGLPTGALTPVEGTDYDFTTARFVGPAVLDTAYTTLARDTDGLARASLDAPGGVGGATVWVDAAFPYLMVYTGDTLGELQRRRRAVAIEPMTCPPNALRTGTDVLALEPGQEWTARLGDPSAMSAGSFAGQVAVVTGSSSGIGAATAQAFAAAGAAVLVNSSRSVEEGEAVAASLPDALYVQGDITEPGVPERLVAAALERWGRLDTLVNNAGTTAVIPHHDLAGASVDVWRRIFEVNVFGTWAMSVAALPALREAHGSVVNVASVAGVRPTGSSIPYAASKAALNHMTVLLAKVVGPEVRVNAVAPGLVDTPWTADWDFVREFVSQATPLKRSGQPEDVAEVILSLARAAYVTGQVVVIDGGLSLTT